MALKPARVLAAFLFFTSSGTAFSQELEYKFITARGSGRDIACDRNNIQMISAGTNMSLVYNDMRLEMPGDGSNRHLAEAGICNVALNVTIPKGYYFTQSSMQVLGGVEKSKGGIVTMTSAMYLTRDPYSTTAALPGAGVYGLTLLAHKIFYPRDIVSEPLLDLSDTKAYTKAQQKAMCNWTKSNKASVGMLVQLYLTGTRLNQHQTTIVSVDGVDANFNLGMQMGKCSLAGM